MLDANNDLLAASDEAGSVNGVNESEGPASMDEVSQWWRNY